MNLKSFCPSTRIWIVYGGDFTIDLDSVSPYAELVSTFASRNGLNRCDKLYPPACKLTYCNDSLQCNSTIDFMLTSSPSLTVEIKCKIPGSP